MLITCPECSRKISDRTQSCPHCGCPMDAKEIVPTRATGLKVYTAAESSALDRFRGIFGVRQTPPTIHVEMPRRTSSLGIASIILGILAFLICWIPFLGVIGAPLSVLGLLLGIIGFLVAMFRRGSGVGFPIAGTAISGLALYVTFTVTWAATTVVTETAKAFTEVERKKSATNQMVLKEDDQSKLVGKEDDQSKLVGWKIKTDTSPIDDSKSYFLTRDADEPIGSGFMSSIPTLMIRYKEGDLEVFIAFGTHLGSGSTTVMYRMGSSPAQQNEWGISTNGKAIFCPTDSVQFVKQLLVNDKLVVRLTPFGESTVTSTFNLIGLSEVIAPMKHLMK